MTLQKEGSEYYCNVCGFGVNQNQVDCPRCGSTWIVEGDF